MTETISMKRAIIYSSLRIYMVVLVAFTSIMCRAQAYDSNGQKRFFTDATDLGWEIVQPNYDVLPMVDEVATSQNCKNAALGQIQRNDQQSGLICRRIGYGSIIQRFYTNKGYTGLPSPTFNKISTDNSYEGWTHTLAKYRQVPVIELHDYCFSRMQGNSKISKADFKYFYFLRTLGTACFAQSGALDTVMNIPNGVDEIGAYAFEACGIKEIVIPEKVMTINAGLFYNCTNLEDIDIRGSVTSIDSLAFSNCKKLRSLSLPSTIVKIGNRAFEDCELLTSLTLPDCVTFIGDKAFYNCTSLSSINVPANTSYIGKQAFAQCANIERLEIPSYVSFIGDDAFNGCTRLNRLVMNCETVPYVRNGFDTNTYNNTVLYVPSSLREQYQADKVWQKFRNIETM